jgi:pSer/pThr/pTyr-binding forkhead associated (FHA) protein
MANSNQPIARLLWQTENGQQEILLHREDVVTIGRGDANTIVLDSAKVSRNHARVEWNGENFAIRDMSSSNGTFVNGQRVEYMPWILKDGDIILLERIPMRFTQISSPAKQDVNALPTVPMGGHRHNAVRPRLIVQEGPDAGREILIDSDELIIGRESKNATWKITLNDPTVSRPHAKIEQLRGGYWLSDLGSANGTTVNDLFVMLPVMLSDGDGISLGATKLVFRLT